MTIGRPRFCQPCTFCAAGGDCHSCPDCAAMMIWGMTWTCQCTCGSQANPGCPEGQHCGGDQCVGPGDSFVDDD